MENERYSYIQYICGDIGIFVGDSCRMWNPDGTMGMLGECNYLRHPRGGVEEGMKDDRDKVADRELDKLRSIADKVVNLPARCTVRKSMSPFGYTEQCQLLSGHVGDCVFEGEAMTQSEIGRRDPRREPIDVAFWDGADTRLCNQSESRNPYTPGTELWRAWRRGYDYAAH